MAMPEPFNTIQAAIISELADEGITCYNHAPLELYAVPSAYLRVTDALPDYNRADQGEVLIGQVQYQLTYYVSHEQDPMVAHEQAYAGVRKVFRAMSGATLTGRVRDARVDRIGVDPVLLSDNRPMLLVEATISVRPAAYV